MSYIVSGLPILRSRLALHTVAAWLGGTPVSYAEEPVVQSVADSNRSSIVPRTEMGFHAIRPDYVLLFCLRNCQTATLIVPSASVVAHLSRLSLETLQKPLCRIHPPPSFKGSSYAGFWRPVVCPRSNRLVVGCITEFANESAHRAYKELMGIVQQNTLRVVLTPGDLMIIDNRFVLHGREEIHPADQESRLLERMYVQLPPVSLVQK